MRVRPSIRPSIAFAFVPAMSRARRRRRARGYTAASIAFVFVPAMSLGCTAATGAVQGGEPTFDAALLTQPTIASTATGDGSTGDDGAPAATNNPLLASDCLDGGMYAGSTWGDLYQCYFGPSGPDSCSGGGNSLCHESSSDTGGGFWVCGDTSESCYMGITGESLLAPQGTTNLMSNGFYNILCQPNNIGSMPFGCPTSALFLPADMARIAAWIDAGAPESN